MHPTLPQGSGFCLLDTVPLSHEGTKPTSPTVGRWSSSADRMGRYANTIRRQLPAAMNELERLQRRRLGEAVPAPITVDVNVNDEKEELIDKLHVPSGSFQSPSLVFAHPTERFIGSGTPKPLAKVDRLCSRTMERCSFAKRTHRSRSRARRIHREGMKRSEGFLPNEPTGSGKRSGLRSISRLGLTHRAVFSLRGPSV